MSKVKTYKLKSVAANKGQKGKTFRMAELPDGTIVPRDANFPLSSDIFVFKTANAAEVVK